MTVWLGLNRDTPNDPWLWPSGDDATYKRWGPQQPDEDIVFGDCVYTKDGLWYNADCDGTTNNVVCFTSED